MFHLEWLVEITEKHGLFVGLVVYVIWDSRQREMRMNAVIDKLCEDLANIESIKNDIKDVKIKICGGD